MPRTTLATSCLRAGLALLLALPPCALAQEAGGAQAAEQPPAPVELREGVRLMIGTARDRVFPALVHIEVVTTTYRGGDEIKSFGSGSGTIISERGHVLTNQHVTTGGTQFKCTLADRQKVTATLVGEDPLTDLAVLALDLDALRERGAELRVARLGDSASLQVGDYVMAMGSPYSLTRSVTLGIVSNVERVFSLGPLGAEMELEPGQRTGLFTRWIQHDALINPGNSGGPLVDLAGDVVGVNELGGSAIGFAIPAELARTVATALIEKGEVVRGSLGVSFRPLEDTDVDEGVLVDSIAAGGPAERAGLRPGDVLLSLDGAPVAARFLEEVPQLTGRIAGLPVGSAVKLTYRRGEEVREAQVAVEKLQGDRGDESAFRAWGFSGQQVTGKMRQDLGLEDTRGVLVTGVRGGSPAQLAQPPLTPGDLIHSVGGAPVESLADLAQRYREQAERRTGAGAAETAAAAAEEEERVLIGFDRRGKSYMTLLEIDEEREKAGAALEVPKPWLGLATQPVLEELAARLGAPDVRGYRITRIYPGTPAAATGLRVGDLVVELEGEPLAPRGMEDANLLDSRVRSLEIGGQATLTVLRDGARRLEAVRLERIPLQPAEAPRERSSGLGLEVRELTFFDRDENRWGREVAGVIVDRVETAGRAELAGMRPADLIERLGRQEVRDLAGFRTALAAALAPRPKRLGVVVRRGGRTHLLYLEPEQDAGAAP